MVFLLILSKHTLKQQQKMKSKTRKKEKGGGGEMERNELARKGHRQKERQI